jgi:ABC-type amino acid transport substrate-binding protein
MVVATNSGWPPQSFLDDSNELAGFDIDVAREVAERLGVEVSFETPEWAIMTGGHWNGRYDLAVGSVTPTKARAEVIDFPAIYYFSPYVFVVHEDSAADSRDDLDGKVIGVETGTTRRTTSTDGSRSTRRAYRPLSTPWSLARCAPMPTPCYPSTTCGSVTACASTR